jgi:hypothetical protein
MGKSPKADLNIPPLDIPPQDPFEAKEAIRKGQVAPIGSYLRDDVRMILESLADQLDVPHADESPPDIAGKTLIPRMTNPGAAPTMIGNLTLPTC